METYNEWLETLKKATLPKYDSLPAIPLYSDQVIEYVNMVLAPIFGKEKYELTGSMINNYVKQKMIPAPHKKRYGASHLAHIIVITVLKQVISIQDISQGIAAVRDEFGGPTAYDTFIGFLEEGIRQILAQTYETTMISLGDTKIENTLIPMKAACVAFAAKLVAENAFESLLERKKNND